MERLTQNTFSQESFSPELNLKELVGDFREASERDSVEVEKKENPGRNIALWFVITKSRRQESPEYRQKRKLILLGRYVLYFL